MVDDLFSDSDVEFQEGGTATAASRTSRLANNNSESLTSTSSSLRNRQEYIDRAIESNHQVMERAHSLLSAHEELQCRIFQDTDEAQAFDLSVRQRLAHDQDFKDRFDIMEQVHSEVIAKNSAPIGINAPSQRRSLPKASTVSSDRKKSFGARVVVPGEPVRATQDEVTSKRNHVVQREMI